MNLTRLFIIHYNIQYMVPMISVFYRLYISENDLFTLLFDSFYEPTILPLSFLNEDVQMRLSYLNNEKTCATEMDIAFLMRSNADFMMTSSIPRNWPFVGPGEFPTQRPVTRSFDVFFDLRLNKRLSKQPWGWWFETP